MRIIGLFTAWGCDRWAVASVANHLRIATELHIMVAPHAPEFKNNEDKTLPNIREIYGRDDRVTIHSPAESPGNCCDKTKCRYLNQMIKAVGVEKGDILFICDVDEFFNQLSVDELQERMLENWDVLELDAMYFVINMQHYLWQPRLARFFRAANRDFVFIPTQRPAFCEPGHNNRQRALHKNPMFHYSLLMPSVHKMAHWSTERNHKDSKVAWLKNLYYRWDLDNEITGNLLVSQNKTGRGFYLNNDMGAPKRWPYMYEYKKPHPEEIEAAGLQAIPDFRKVDS